MKRLITAGGLGAALLLLAVTAGASAAGPQESQPFQFQDTDGTFLPADPIAGASAKLVRTPNGISAHINTNSLPAGTYTVWFIVWNDPAQCVGGCGEDDLGAPGNLVARATGGQVGQNGVGGFGGHLRVGDISETILGLDNAGNGLMKPMEAETHMIVRYHGPVVASSMPDQIHDVFGECTPDSSFGFGTGDFFCYEPQAVVFLAP